MEKKKDTPCISPPGLGNESRYMKKMNPEAASDIQMSKPYFPHYPLPAGQFYPIPPYVPPLVPPSFPYASQFPHQMKPHQDSAILNLSGANSSANSGPVPNIPYVPPSIPGSPNPNPANPAVPLTVPMSPFSHPCQGLPPFYVYNPPHSYYPPPFWYTNMGTNHLFY